MKRYPKIRFQCFWREHGFSSELTGFKQNRSILREAGGSAVPGLSFREILSMLLSGNYQRVVRMLMDFCRTALFREISENGRWMGQVILLGILGAVFASFFESLCRQSRIGDGLFMSRIF